MTQTLIPAYLDGQLCPVEKLKAHRLGLRHKAVSVFVLRRGNLLLQQRALGKYHTPGLWANTCCTHPHWGEAPLDCAKRRLAEELGLPGLNPFSCGQVHYRAEVGGGLIEDEDVSLFKLDAPEDLEPVPNPEEVLDTRWVEIADLEAEISRSPEKFTPWLRIYLAEHRHLILGD
ncbi:isopentenyl-diphosphate delta-isomerase [Poseidonocella pacifica]|uniref:Isopentenyl-diphosphate Delta-isomerase n=1 Tax=Poseidonocella pacifica TaxID=871651 RepID=A0A1I0XUW5_9RHOB|nr:isopentenyl-diphosphate delta-isomerase [Poseidonocella pacifica]SFB04929.1 isopentenyl-diphosphate delta-isomerase [Poseidonocella pacifica]